MSLVDMMQAAQEREAGSVMSIAIAVVTNNEDPDGEARIKVKYPWRNVEDESYWARIATFMGGNEMGGYFLPEVNDEVVVAFENGDIDFPIIIGSLWSTKMKPPEINDDGKNNRRLIKSRSGHLVILDDTDGGEKIEIIDKSEKNKITIDTTANLISIESEQDIELKAPKGKILLDAKELELKSKANTKIEAGANLEAKAKANAVIEGGANLDTKAGAILTVKGSMVKIN